MLDEVLGKDKSAIAVREIFGDIVDGVDGRIGRDVDVGPARQRTITAPDVEHPHLLFTDATLATIAGSCRLTGYEFSGNARAMRIAPGQPPPRCGQVRWR